ncbi:tRNA (adenosine(37)-N6)-threonylcarbamoyltransferase complex ATPase subunit type 1 TsaE [Salinisphaera sp. Q1T1-3]|uniref:tRNA (adenosine(37)-N6)-threonylcarbamoyltransferase complex ATPase subunit type 1 TsaE n=1 Tax=Salinisphaera sp. Q1T1-3 TaxID=2321229 RepID=UPI000E75246F|nr:tRNA (adenosine(37)-N6)-threonylcarbamoyltransferase complex ATPase subunit type 1 TsaE [Salinisphaera sp. Q1T1-3]RJS93787.1 tRNA (adenosine(37)-N6)-threonylcarbamoyltransferase complex ATPase subunit type 1 TsaE [Salinisphaera sp. Q1T1-3]
MNLRLVGPAETEALGHRLARALALDTAGAVVHLRGELGAGKTALVRATLQGLGHEGAVVSPSYTLIEPYAIGTRQVFHLDLYRLGDPEELEFLGIRELNPATDLVLVEWPERGAGFLPSPDLLITLDYDGDGRCAVLEPESPAGQAMLARLDAPGEPGR